MLPVLRLLCVAPQLVDQVWPHVRHFIVAALERGNGDETERSILNESLLWVVSDGTNFLGAAVTHLYYVPSKGPVCQIMACGGTLDICREFIGGLEDYARAEKCVAMRISGRRGWKKVLKDYREPFIMLEKQL